MECGHLLHLVYSSPDFFNELADNTDGRKNDFLMKECDHLLHLVYSSPDFFSCPMKNNFSCNFS